jgi:hypothetical protein
MKTIAAVLFAMPALAMAQQAVKPPVASYWMSVETAAGMSIPGMGGAGGFMAGMMGAQGQSGQKMVLQLGSQRPSADAPRADHFIPSGLNMGPSLPLVTPQRVPAEREPTEMPQGMEKPKGRMLIYWGCGESARSGQPVIVDFAALSQGQVPAGMTSRRVSVQSGPSSSRAKTYGDWPNQRDSKAVPASASLKGDHQIKGNYSPDIQFALGEGQDFMDRVDLATAARGAGAVNVSWNAVSNATGYFAMVFGSDGNDSIMWSSSDLQEMGGMLMNYLPPAEVARLIREKVVLAPSVTECTVPAEVVKKAGGTPFFNFIAYGPEANFAQPPRPADPKQAWEPLWAVKVRFKSTASTLLGDASGGGGRRPVRTQAPAGGEAGGEQADVPAQKPAAGPDPVKEGVNILRGIFGR